MRQDNRGMSLIELMVILGVFAIILGAGLPSVFKAMDNAKRSRAQQDCAAIAAACKSFQQDTDVVPGITAAGNPFCLFGPDGAPLPTADPGTGWSFGGTSQDWLSRYLITNQPWGAPANAYALFKGRYLAKIPADPWGNPYVVIYSDSTNVYFVLSMGPNGIIDTAKTSYTIMGDDVGMACPGTLP
jgi:type II secretory pathway pseudopilin PulG